MQRLRGLTRSLLRQKHQITVKVNAEFRETIYFSNSLSVKELLEELKEKKYQGVDDAQIYSKSGACLPPHHEFHHSHGTVTVDPHLRHPSATSPAPPSRSGGSNSGSGGVSVMDHLRNGPSKGGTSSSAASTDKVFGATVETYVDDNDVPLVISKTIDFLDNALYLTEQGLFRISGVKSEIDALRDSFDESSGSYDIPENTDPHNVSVLLKLYLKTLPEPLFPFTVFDQVLNIEKEYPDDEVRQARQVQAVIDNQLDNVRRQALRRLLLFLAKLSSFSNVNQMTASNLAIVIGPNILRPETETMAIFQQMAAINRITERTIRHASIVCHQHPPSSITLRGDSLSRQPSVHLGTNTNTNTNTNTANTLSSSSLSSSSSSLLTPTAAPSPYTITGRKDHHQYQYQYQNQNQNQNQQHQYKQQQTLVYECVVQLADAVRESDPKCAHEAVDKVCLLVDEKRPLACEAHRKEFCEAGGIRETVAAVDVLWEDHQTVSAIVLLWMAIMRSSRAVIEGTYQPGSTSNHSSNDDRWRGRWDDTAAENWMQDRDEEAEGAIMESVDLDNRMAGNNQNFIEYWRQEDDEDVEDEDGEHDQQQQQQQQQHQPSLSISPLADVDVDIHRVITRTLRVMADPTSAAHRHDDVETLIRCVGVLGHLTNVHRYRMTIQRLGGVPCIFQLLKTTASKCNNTNNNNYSTNNTNNTEGDQITLVARLLQLLRRFLKSRRAKAFVAQHDGVSLIAAILGRHNNHSRIAQNAVIALHLLANNKSTTAANTAFADANVLPAVYTAALEHFPDSVEVQRYAASLTALLVSFNPSGYVPYAMNTGAVPTLTAILDNPVSAANALIVTQCCRALGRIAKQFPDEVRRYNAVSLCVQCMQQFPESADVHRYALRALAVMAVGDTQHVVYHSGAVDSAVGALAVFGGARQGKALSVLSLACRMLEQVLQSSPQAARDNATSGLAVGLVHLIHELHDNDEVANDAVHALAALLSAGGEEARKQVSACGALTALYQLKTMHQSMPQASNVAKALVEQLAHNQ